MHAAYYILRYSSNVYAIYLEINQRVCLLSSNKESRFEQPIYLAQLCCYRLFLKPLWVINALYKDESYCGDDCHLFFNCGLRGGWVIDLDFVLRGGLWGGLRFSGWRAGWVMKIADLRIINNECSVNCRNGPHAIPILFIYVAH